MTNRPFQIRLCQRWLRHWCSSLSHFRHFRCLWRLGYLENVLRTRFLSLPNAEFWRSILAPTRRQGAPFHQRRPVPPAVLHRVHLDLQQVVEHRTNRQIRRLLHRYDDCHHGCGHAWWIYPKFEENWMDCECCCVDEYCELHHLVSLPRFPSVDTAY